MKREVSRLEIRFPGCFVFNFTNLSLAGFTLIELMLVVIIIGILSAMVVPRLAGRSEQARIQAAKTDVNSSIPLALDLYEMDLGHYPELLDYLRIRPGADVQSWRGPYLKKKPLDPWGKAYIYKAPGEHNSDSYDLSSMGNDGKPDTADDLVNWGE